MRYWSAPPPRMPVTKKDMIIAFLGSGIPSKTFTCHCYWDLFSGATLHPWCTLWLRRLDESFAEGRFALCFDVRTLQKIPLANQTLTMTTISLRLQM